jgi:hypothetical protein
MIQKKISTMGSKWVKMLRLGEQGGGKSLECALMGI